MPPPDAPGSESRANTRSQTGAALAIDLADARQSRGKGIGSLGPFLAWAVVFADLGTSIYYVPGVLYGQLGATASAFVLLTTVAFVLVALEHLEVAHRYPAGGGGVSAAVEAFGPRVGIVSGALMVSAYLLTIAIATVTAMSYLGIVNPLWPDRGLVSSLIAIVVLGVLSWSGPRIIAKLAFLAAIATVATHAWLFSTVVRLLPPSAWPEMVTEVARLRHFSFTELATGFAGAWLAYSGLESLGQLAPSVREPRRKVIRTASALLVGSVLVTVPVFTTVAIEAVSAGKIAPGSALLAEVALRYGGQSMQLAVVGTGVVLLLVAAKLAFIGCYNVFAAIGEHGYLPAIVARTSSPGQPPRGAVVVITLSALALVAGADGQVRILVQLFAFGLLGSYVITSISLDVLRWRDGKRGITFVLGALVSLTVALPWVLSWFTKWRATLYGALTSGALLLVAYITHRGWIRAGRFGFLSAASAEAAAAELSTALEVLTLDEAAALRQSYPSTTLLALRSNNRALCQEVARRAKGAGDTAVYVVYVDEIPGFLFPPRRGPSPEALRVLRAAVTDLREAGIDAVPVWRLAHDAGASIAETAEELSAACVFVGTNHRNAVWHFLEGNVLKRLVAELPNEVHVVICE
jgi:amino acid transporter/nucleotide-binding universal stress UspA family protein